MVRVSEYGKVAEEIVFKYLKKRNKHVYRKGTTGYHFNFGDIQIGKNRNTCKIIEVKGQSKDWDSDTKWDVPRRYIQISKTEYNFLKKNPDRFDVYVVYRLIYDRNPEYKKHKVAICKGSKLLSCKKEVRQIVLVTPTRFWATTKQFNP